MLQATIRFEPDREDLSADGWVVILSDDASIISTTYYATITLATAAITTAYSTDPSIDAYFEQAAEDSVLVTEAAAVASTKASLLTAEGL